MRPRSFPVLSIFFFLNGNQRSRKLSHAPHTQAQIHLCVFHMFMQGRLLWLPPPRRFEWLNLGVGAPQQLWRANGTEVAWRSIIADVQVFFFFNRPSMWGAQPSENKHENKTRLRFVFLFFLPWEQSDFDAKKKTVAVSFYFQVVQHVAMTAGVVFQPSEVLITWFLLRPRAETYRLSFKKWKTWTYKSSNLTSSVELSSS